MCHWDLLTGAVTVLSIAAVVLAAPLTTNIDPNSDVAHQLGGEEEALEALSKAGSSGGDLLNAPKPASLPVPVQGAAIPAKLMPKVSEEKVITKEDLSLDLTPRAVAEYLLITGDFEGFDKAVHDLIKANMVKDEEARQYKDAVGFEYEGLLRRLVDAKEAYLEEFIEASANGKSVNQERTRRVDPSQSGNSLQEGAMDNTNVDLGVTLRRMQLRSLLEKEATLDELLQALVEDYLIKGLTTGSDGKGMAEGKTAQEDDIQALIDLLSSSVNQGINKDLSLRNNPAPVAPQSEQPQPEQPQSEAQHVAVPPGENTAEESSASQVIADTEKSM